MSETASAGLYVHVPFCRSKCLYCGFYSEPAQESAARWVASVLLEAEHHRDRFPAFDTVYFGGGTPSLLEERLLSELLQGLAARLPLTADPEITLEANPDDITRRRLRCWRDLGINRLSVGVQSFDDSSLRFLGRRHSASRAAEALQLARQAGFANLGIDLIWGLPGQGIDAWLATLEKALGFHPEHLSCYQLEVERGTPLHGLVEARQVLLPDDDVAAAFFVETSRRLSSHGYLHYEISNFARAARFRSRHNRKYWLHVPYLGLGPSAHSFDGVKRWWNVRSTRQYCQRLEARIAPTAAEETLDPEARRLEMVLLGFRTCDGVHLDRLGRGPDVTRALDQAVDSGLVTIEDDRAVPSLNGWLIADRLPLLF